MSFEAKNSEVFRRVIRRASHKRAPTSEAARSFTLVVASPERYGVTLTVRPSRVVQFVLPSRVPRRPFSCQQPAEVSTGD